jgi:glycerol kinase
MENVPSALPLPGLEALKLGELGAEAKTQHVEDKNKVAVGTPPAAATPVSKIQLPRGIHETVAEKKEHWFVGSIDQGTTSSRFLIFNGEGSPVASHQIEFENIYPQSGYARHRSSSN